MPGESVRSAPTIFAAEFLPEGEHLIAADSTGHLLVWGIPELLSAEYWENAKEGHKPSPTFTHRLHDCSIYSIALLGGGKVLLTGGDDCIKAWDVASLIKGGQPKLFSSVVHPQQTIGRGAMTPIPETNGLSVSKDSTVFYSAAGDGRAYSWDVASMKLTGQFEGHKDYLHCIACQGQNGLVTGSEDGAVRLWDTRTRAGEELYMSKEAPKAWVGAVAADDGGNFVVGGGGGRCMYLWHVASRRVVASMPTCGTVQSVSFCDDKIMSAGSERAFYRWRCNGKLHSRVPTTCDSVFTLAHTKLPSQSDFSLVTAGAGGDVSFYYRAGAELGFQLSWR